MKHYCAKPSGFNDWRSDIVENKYVLNNRLALKHEPIVF